MTSNLYICSTYYHVYITLCKVLTENQKADLMICDDIPTGKRLSEQIQKSGIFQHTWFVEESKYPEVRGANKLDWILFQHKRRRKEIEKLLPVSLKKYSSIFIYHDGIPLGMYLNDAHLRYHLIEDSLNFYQRFHNTAQGKYLKPHNLKFFIRKALNSGYFPLGDSNFIIDIEVNENKNLQLKGKKIKEVPRKNYEKKLTSVQKEKIQAIFELQKISDLPEHSALLLTEPLFIDEVCNSQEEQLAIYKSIVQELKRGGLYVILKPHPRDKTDYSELCIPQWDAYFPIELLNDFPNIRFDCAVAVSSSAIFTIKNVSHRFWWKNGKLSPVKLS